MHIVTELQRRKESTIFVYFRSRFKTMSQNKNKKRFFLTTDESRTPFRIDRGNQPRNFDLTIDLIYKTYNENL
jgi:hypothetical protein